MSLSIFPYPLIETLNFGVLPCLYPPIYQELQAWFTLVACLLYIFTRSASIDNDGELHAHRLLIAVSAQLITIAHQNAVVARSPGRSGKYSCLSPIMTTTALNLPRRSAIHSCSLSSCRVAKLPNLSERCFDPQRQQGRPLQTACAPSKAQSNVQTLLGCNVQAGHLLPVCCQI